MKPSSTKWVYLFCWLAGTCDGTTGLLLVLAPLYTLQLMGVSSMPVEPVYMRWIGVFVMSVGAVYLYPFLYRDAKERDGMLRAMLTFTALIRVCVAGFVLSSVVMRHLVPDWLTVFFTDAALATIQIVMLKKGVLTSADE